MPIINIFVLQRCGRRGVGGEQKGARSLWYLDIIHFVRFELPVQFHKRIPQFSRTEPLVIMERDHMGITAVFANWMNLESVFPIPQILPLQLLGILQRER